jgi:hypothetical protein
VCSDHRRTDRHHVVDGRGVRGGDVEVDAVLRLLSLEHLGEVPGRLRPFTVGAADRGEAFAASHIERSSEQS